METITLRSVDGQQFMVNEATAMEFGVVRLFFEGGAGLGAEGIPLPNVTGVVLRRVIRYCETSMSLHSILPPATVLHLFEPVAELFLVNENDRSIVELVKAADYLNIEVLLAFLLPSFKNRFGLGDDKGVEYVYSEYVDAHLEAAGF